MKKTWKVLLMVFLMLITTCIPVSAATKISLNKKNISVTVGKKYQLSISGTSKKVKWTTNDKKIATVSKNGLVTAKKTGKAVITAKVGKKSYKCNVTVKAKPAQLKNFKASVTELKCGEKKQVIFSVKKEGKLGDIYLYNSKNKKIGRMHDDGKKGDKKKKDGIYSIKVTVNSKTPKALTYYAKSSKVKTAKIKICVYSAPTTSSKNDAEKAANTFADIEKKYQQSDGTVAPEKRSQAINEAKNYAKQLVKSGAAIYYEVSDTGVSCKMSSGLTIVYQVNQDGYDSIGDNVSMNIITMQPFRHSYDSSLESIMQKPDDAARAIATEFSNYSFRENLDESAVTLEKIRNIGSNQIVIWHGHGGYDTKNHSFLCTGENFDWDKWFWDVGYWWDCVQDRILSASNGRAMFTSKYVDKYCGNMNNSLLYLAACESGKDDVLARAFLNKGAAAVVGNSETILTVYNLSVESETLTNMTKVNPNTKNYYTLGEALAMAKKVYGSNDGSSLHAYPIIFGGNNAQNYRFGDVKPGELKGKVASANDRSIAVPNAKIEITENGNSVKTVVSDSNGEYAVTLTPGTYLLKISADGYIPFSCYAEVESSRTKYMESFLMINGQESDQGVLCGYISNATTGRKVPDVHITIRNDWNNPSIGNIVGETNTDSNGYYEVLNVPIGHYTIVISKNGFVTTNFNVLVQKTDCREQNASIAEQSLADMYQIVLTWNDDPWDLDAHMTGTTSAGNSFHVYFRSKNCYDNGKLLCNLDVDDTSGYGPETISVQVNNTTPYYYYVYKYGGNRSLNASEAQVKVYKSGKLLATYNVPTDQGTGRYWNVFSIVNGKIITSNTIADSSDIGYATSNKLVSQAAKADLYLDSTETSDGKPLFEGMERK